MSLTKSKRATSAKIVGSGQRHEINLKSIGTTSKRQDASQTRVGPCKSGFIYICSGCNKPIKRDKFLLKACDKYWHENCLRCDRCHSRLGELGSTLYFKSDMNLCRQDYLEMFGKTGVCSVCEKMICASEMVMRAKQNVYHLECFACQLCNQRFCVGDRFYLCENKVVCQYDYEEHILPIQRSMIEHTTDQMYDPSITSHETQLGPIQLETIKLDSSDDQLTAPDLAQDPEEATMSQPEKSLSDLDDQRDVSDMLHTKAKSVSDDDDQDTMGGNEDNEGDGESGEAEKRLRT